MRQKGEKKKYQENQRCQNMSILRAMFGMQIEKKRVCGQRTNWKQLKEDNPIA